MSINHDKLKEAFKCNTSGNGLCYYGATINNIKYSGERQWDTRWEIIKDCLDFNNKNVLELGCNMGILLTYLKKYNNINRAVGVDEPDEMLIRTNKRDTIKAAKLLGEGLGVLDISYIQLDLNIEDYEHILGSNFDIVIAMSIYKWIDDNKKERFLEYLSKFNTIIYEGHDSDEIEIQRFSKYDFKYNILGKTQTGVSYSNDNTRTIMVFSK